VNERTTGMISTVRPTKAARRPCLGEEVEGDDTAGDGEQREKPVAPQLLDAHVTHIVA
jgi:hypothetical protein